MLLVLAMLVLVALVAASVVAVAARTQAEERRVAQEARGYTPASIGPTPVGSINTIAVVGDESISRAASGVARADVWPALLAAPLDARMVQVVSTGAGFVGTGPDDETIAVAARKVPAEADVVVLIGGAHDAGLPRDRTADGVERAVAAARSAAPAARIVVVGPLTAKDATDTVRDALTRGSVAADVPFVDPVGRGWLPLGAPRAPTRAQQRTLATKLEPVLRGLLPNA